MERLDYVQIIKLAWKEFDGDRHEIKRVFDVSAKVSTNHVYKISFYEREPVFAKLSEYGQFEDFREDHIIINNLANNLEYPYQMFLAQSLVKRNELFIYRYHEPDRSAWLVFYNPILIREKMPRRLNEKQIRKLGRELARFHKACTNVSNQLPLSSKNVVVDIQRLRRSINKNEIKMCDKHRETILRQADCFLENTDRINATKEVEVIPVFVDWNIGNFSVTGDGKFYSRWDYDWFRMSSRVMDFYFFSRVVSDVGDRTVFSYLVDTLMEDRFMMFLKEYHRIFPLTEAEVLLIKETYRFFILNYVIKDGPYFFRTYYSNKLIKEAYDTYFPAMDANYRVEKIMKTLKM
ncbi:hypothetical protein SAMN05444274_103290 [Mariniphaga anaerophila]|uniref:Ser/Thr protein kinase RdoA involved in Cpx stress response, MazF antagonist n=1 Tax=Mariniphaga anaerophila TaxID=1484053 RepID=A0A1M4YAY7_9BACT|nr:hypothetical protein [Mariniphaga anaerophila]SHF02756.1 hypothetical protein SAMN05444274_103290 [Mariniphaga anaerophila]